MTPDSKPPICDYEGYAYQQFWQRGRDYEDAAERIALARMLPPRGHRLAEIGAGYGRLVPLYAGYAEVVLVDRALSQLREARSRYGPGGEDGCPAYRYVAADFYCLPFLPGVFDTVTMVRVLHHASDPQPVLEGAAAILAPGGAFVLEFANKRNLKAILRYVVRKQSWSPFDPEPIEFLPLHYDYHPDWVHALLAARGLKLEIQRTVSHFRIGLLKRLVPTRLLAWLDGLLQPTGALWQLTPSVFVRSVATRGRAESGGKGIFRCVGCGSGPLAEQADAVTCPDCGARYPITDGIYDLRGART